MLLFMWCYKISLKKMLAHLSNETEHGEFIGIKFWPFMVIYRVYYSLRYGKDA